MDFPAARASASAAFVRSLINRRSHCASVAIMFATISPVAVLVSMPTSSATSCHPSERLRSSRRPVRPGPSGGSIVSASYNGSRWNPDRASGCPTGDHDARCSCCGQDVAQQATLAGGSVEVHV
jgi:hypothetical protein